MLSEKPWRLDAVILFFAAIFGCFCLSMIANEFLRKAGVAAFQQPESPGVIVIGTFGFQGVVWMLMPVFLHHHRERWSDAIGLRGPKLKRALGFGALAALLILPAAWLLQNLSINLLTHFGWKADDQLAVSLFKKVPSNGLRIYLGLFAVVIAPVAEEFTFRGMLYPMIKQLGFPRLALFGVSLLFAAIHFDVATFVPLFILALWLTWLYEKMDNLLAPIAAHATFNAVNLIVLLDQSGVFRAPK
jgi:membrane protease YdiL (CAAX protease family)